MSGTGPVVNQLVPNGRYVRAALFVFKSVASALRPF